MDQYQCETKLQKQFLFPVNVNELRWIMEVLFKEEREYGAGRHRKSWQEVHDLLENWYRNGLEYGVQCTYLDMASFVSSHRLACIWAVLLRKGHQEMKELKLDEIPS